ncbi:hypothetical protein [Terasakiella sp. SH-1]|uniref:hypothetical protein n=1 Tax=Terasakiella sp. SH-1 TaxID=2560057 RepID=UPI00107362A6|nr:hypothetical protein [Terasakiella sp. SH-1]
MKASDLGRDFSKAALEERLGPFKSPKKQQSHKKHKKQRINRNRSLNTLKQVNCGIDISARRKIKRPLRIEPLKTSETFFNTKP